jgi:Polyketide cyclase / dehydrase and lipid transport
MSANKRVIDSEIVILILDGLPLNAVCIGGILKLAVMRAEEDTMSCLCSWLRAQIHSCRVIRYYLFAIPHLSYSKKHTKNKADLEGCYKDSAAIILFSRQFKQFLHPLILYGALLTSAIANAEISPEIEKYTIQRDKTSEFVSTALLSGKRPEIEINEHSGAYQIKVVALIAAPARYVRYVLTDYRHIYRLNPSIIESEVLEKYDDSSVSVRTRVLGCAAYFCEELDRVEKVRVLPSGDLYAEIIPELSQFKSGQTHWRIKPQGDYCEVTYLSDMEPDIYIPPVVGKFLVKKSIREGMHVSLVNLEKISSVLAEREWLNNDLAVDDRSVAGVIADSPCNTNVSNALAISE